LKDDLLNARPRADEELMAKHGKEKAFLTGGNSSCRYHARQHYNLYKQRCKEANISEHHWAIPRQIWKEMEALKNGKRSTKQTDLDGVVQKVTSPREFTRGALRHAVTQFIACDDQVSRK
jgi:DNA-binding LacI/PurR family transcriptional regulator